MKINSCTAVTAAFGMFAAAMLSQPAAAANVSASSVAISATEGPWSRDEFYVGAQAGAAFNAGATDWQGYGFSQNTANTLSNKAASSVFAGGLLAGWMHRFESAPVVLGPEIDINYLGNFRSKNSVTYVRPVGSPGIAPAGTYYLHSGRSANYYGTVGAHLGYVMDNVQVFMSGGFAYGGNNGAKENTVVYTDPLGASVSYTGSGSNQSHWGHAFGVGGEYAIDSSLAARLEYQYIGLKNSNITFTPPGGAQHYIVNDIKEHFSVIRVGVVYSF